MSFDIALSGIQAINEQLNATSNNIANAGTFGFKSTRANFSAMYAGAAPTGVEIGSTTQSIGVSGGVLNTGRGLDAKINGAGFFVSRDAQGAMNYSRVGIFNASSDGYLIDSAGRKVQGYAAVEGSTALGAMGDMVVPTGQIPAKPTTTLAYTGNMSTDWVTPAAGATPDYNMSQVSVVYDSRGTKHTLTQTFTELTPTTVRVDYSLDGTDLDAATSKTLTFTTAGVLDPAGAGGPSQTLTMNPGAAAPAFSTLVGATPLTIVIDYTGSTQLAGDAITSTNNPNGYASGTYNGIELASDGSVVAKYTNGQKQTIGTIALATFPDEGALTAVNDTSWTTSNTSGAALYNTPGKGMAGDLTTSALEQSNVDITSELVGLMTSQRNYQANSKVISTENAMLQSLMQAL